MPASISSLAIKYNLCGKILREYNFSFAENTTYGCGGIAKVAFLPDNIPAAKCAYDIASKGEFVILGNGSNILAADGAYNGAVVSTKKLCGIYKVHEDVICCLPGTKISKLLNYCAQNNLSGLEYLYGIPATVGGAAYMNAGIRGSYIGKNVIKIRLYNGKLFDLSQKDCNFEYKHSTMRDINAIILCVYLKIEPNCDKNKIINNILYYKDLRKNLPKGRSCGCVFKNIEDYSAGKIIQDCSLENFSVGLARVSEEHCNFILNEGATSSDIKKLIEIVKQKVSEKTSYKLEEEVIYIGDFNDSNS